MSCTESYTGMIKEINLPSELIKVEEIVEFISLNFKIPEDKFEIYNNKITYIDSEKVLLDFKTGKWYEVLEKKYYDIDEDFFIAKCNNGIIDFSVQYYNGGCSFNEAISKSIENMTDNDELETLSISKEQIKNWLVDAYKTQSWSQINKLIVMFGGEWIVNK